MKQIKEQWLPVPFSGYDKVYEVSTTGKVRRIDNKKERRQYQHKKGYCRIVMSYKGKTLNISIHRLVALTFIDNPNPEEFTQVGHLDDDKENNCVDNLYWTNAQENNTHGGRIAKSMATWDIKRKAKQAHKQGKPTPVFCLIPTSYSGATAVWYRSISEASRESGIKATDISATIKGIRQSAGGYRWVMGYEKEGFDTPLY